MQRKDSSLSLSGSVCAGVEMLLCMCECESAVWHYRGVFVLSFLFIRSFYVLFKVSYRFSYLDF
jgi:hypothetical protein